MTVLHISAKRKKIIINRQQSHKEISNMLNANKSKPLTATIQKQVSPYRATKSQQAIVKMSEIFQLARMIYFKRVMTFLFLE